MTIPFTIPNFTIPITARLELQFGGQWKAWALPLGISWGQCDLNHAPCITFQFLCVYITLMVFKKL